jgi:hypothetical protein
MKVKIIIVKENERRGVVWKRGPLLDEEATQRGAAPWR